VLLSLVSSRLRERGVPDIQSVYLVRDSEVRKMMGDSNTADLWNNCHIDALRLLVPNMIIGKSVNFVD